ncbi:MAG: hypothetical protein AAFX99_36765, partial [Myxococcota bacterium]
GDLNTSVREYHNALRLGRYHEASRFLKHDTCQQDRPLGSCPLAHRTLSIAEHRPNWFVT